MSIEIIPLAEIKMEKRGIKKGMATAILCNLAEPDLFSEDDLQRIKELSDSDDHMVGTNAECLLEILEN